MAKEITKLPKNNMMALGKYALTVVVVSYKYAKY